MPTWEPPAKRRSISRKERVEIFMRTQGRCYVCSQALRGAAWDVEHPQALALGGSDETAALMPICKVCHRGKTAKDKAAIEKCKRVRDRHIGAKKSANPLPGSRSSNWKRTFSSGWIRRDAE